MSSPLETARRLLCVQPHYDDNDLGAGGTIAALRDAGAEIHYVTVTDDLTGVRDASLSDSDARAQLRREQEQAGAEIGVTSQRWLDYPDAGDFDVFALRRDLIREIRRLRPDFLLTVDPWLQNEVHPDHLRTGQAAAQAVVMHALPRLRTEPEIDSAYEPYELGGVAFYFTREPNLCFDISDSRERKHRALDAYRAQFSESQLQMLHLALEAKEREWARSEAFSHGEALKVLAPSALHVGL